MSYFIAFITPFALCAAALLVTIGCIGAVAGLSNWIDDRRSK